MNTYNSVKEMRENISGKFKIKVKIVIKIQFLNLLTI